MTDTQSKPSPTPQEATISPGDNLTVSRRPHFVWWIIAGSLAVIAIAQVTRFGVNEPAPWPGSAAMAQSVGSAGAHGVFAFTGQLTKGSYGVFMVDVDTGTIWCYEYQSGNRVLKLVAARKWIYDRYLENHSTEPPIDVVEQMLEDQRAAAMQAATP